MNDDAHDEDSRSSNPRWNLLELRKGVERLHGRDQSKALMKSTESIWKRLWYMNYHYGEADRLVNATLKEEPSLEVLTKYVFPNSKRESEEFHARRFKAEAHIVAFMQSGHAILDTLGHAIFFALKLDQLKPSQVALHTVVALLHEGDLRDRGQAFLDDPEIKHLAALVNHSKHRSVIEPNVLVSFVEDTQPHGLKFSMFQHKGEWFAARWAVPFTNLVFDRLQHHVFQIGHALNDLVGARAAALGDGLK